MDVCEQAEALRLMLLMGLSSASEIVAWADDVIAARDDAPAWLLDVSLAAGADDSLMESRLRDLPCEGDRTAAAFSALDRFAEGFRSGRIPPESAAQMLYNWAAGADVNEGDRTAAMTPMWVAVELGEGHASDRDVVAAVEKCLTRFAPRSRLEW